MLSNDTVIFGGSFDPPHIGHQAMVMWMIDALDCKRIEIVPTAVHCFGKQLTDLKDRINMCELAFERYKPIVHVSGVESALPTPNLTANLINHYSQFYDNLAVVIGADNLNQIHRWTRWDEVLASAKVVAVGRPGFDLKESYPFDVEVYSVGISTVSSTEVRDKIANNQSLDGLVSSNVKHYIERRGLYKNEKNDSGAG